MRDAFLGFSFSAKGDEGFALEVEYVLLADELWHRERAAGEDVGQLTGDVRVVVGSVTAAGHQVNGHFGGSEEGFAENFNLGSLRAFLPAGGDRLPAGADQRKGGLFGVGNEA